MKKKLTIFVAAVNLLMASRAQATSIDLALPDKFNCCAVVAEMTIVSARTTHDDVLMLDELTCAGRVIRPFKGCQSNDVVALRVHRLDTNTVYLGKTFLVFAFALNGQLRPFGAQQGLIEKGHEFTFPVINTAAGTAQHLTLSYTNLLAELERMKAANTASHGTAPPRRP